MIESKNFHKENIDFITKKRIPMFPRLLLLFTIVPLVELALLVYVSQFISPLGTILLVIITGVIGAALARHEGMRCWHKIQEKLTAGHAPGAELIEGPMILLAGAMLITPGILTDFCGFMLLIPPTRKAIARRLAARFRSRFTVHTPDGFASGWTSGSEDTNERDEIIDVTFTNPDGSKITDESSEEI